MTTKWSCSYVAATTSVKHSKRQVRDECVKNSDSSPVTSQTCGATTRSTVTPPDMRRRADILWWLQPLPVRTVPTAARAIPSPLLLSNDALFLVLTKPSSNFCLRCEKPYRKQGFLYIHDLFFRQISYLSVFWTIKDSRLNG